MEHREGPKGRWSACHVELTPCELRLYNLDSSANRQLATAYSLSHCQSVGAAPPQAQDRRVLQALFFNSTRLQLRASCQWEALDWRRLIWERVLAARPPVPHADNKLAEALPTPMSPSPSSSSGLDMRLDGDSPTPGEEPPPRPAAPPARPTALPLFTQRCADVLKAGLLHQLTDLNNWRAFTFVLSRSSLRAFPTEGRGPVSEPLLRYQLASCLAVQRHEDQDPATTTSGPSTSARFQVVFPSEVLHLRAESQPKAQDWIEALRRVVEVLRPQGEDGGVLLRSRPARERKQREAQRAKRQSVTTSFLSILTCLAVEKGLTTQSFRCAGV